jgi:hypothetical protein
MAHEKWFLRPSQLVGLTPAKARDLIAQCFFESEKDTYAKSLRARGRELSYLEVRKLVDGTVRRAFEATGNNYHEPTKQALKDVVNVLMKKAAAWKTPADLIVHHREELGRIIANLP